MLKYFAIIIKIKYIKGEYINLSQEKRENIDFVYIDGINKQVLFYPEYIVIKKIGIIWIIETKGG